ncbi:MAG: hypothetical protein NTY19_00585 [Planctomycetota bacterium]|nr:hypothetical protein [Planctomycetota bacterium]
MRSAAPRKTTCCATAAAILTVCLATGPARDGYAYSPESAEVVQMINRALGYLQKAQHESVGGSCLIGLAFFKTGAVAHPKVQEALQKAHQLAEKVKREGVGENCYNEATACIFLCEVDPDAHRGDIEVLLGGLLQRQTADGMWTYKSAPTADTSQTQYGMLAIWTAHTVGFTAQVGSVERASHWLLRTQSTDGGFTYQPADPGPKNPKPQLLHNATQSMSAAGLGALYVAAHLFRIGQREPDAKEQEEKLPSALQKVGPPKKKDFVYLKPQSVDAAAVRRALALGDGWFDAKFKTENTADQRFTYYYLYGLERYKSFKEIVDGKAEEEPAWYNAVVEYLKQHQQPSGAWEANFVGTAVDTSFGVLFLVRSTKTSIKKATIDEGILIGGKGLPKNIENVRMLDGKVVTPQAVRDVDDLLKLLDRTENPDFDARSLPGVLSLDEDLTKRNSQLQRLRVLVTDDNFDTRLAAVKTLAKANDLNNVPVLIFALGDTDWRVIEAAKLGLCFISRKFEGLGPQIKPSEAEQKEAQRKWKKWYLSIRPDGELLE